MESKDYYGILEQNVLPSARKLVLSCSLWVLQQDDDQKHKTLSRITKNQTLDISKVPS